MPPGDWRIRIADIIESIHKVVRYTAGQTRETFGSDEKTVDAVVRNLTIIGEAATHIPEEVETRHADLPWAEMRGMRNVVVHEYFGVDIDILWETVLHDLPPLVAPLQRLLEQHPTETRAVMSPVEELLEQIEALGEEEQCELLERLLLKQPSTPETDVRRMREIRSKLPRLSERSVAHDADAAIAGERRDRRCLARRG